MKIIERGKRPHIFSVFPDVIKAWGIQPRSIVHVGAHKGEEVPFYKEAGFQEIILVEPNPALVDNLRAIEGVKVVEAACDMQAGIGELHVSRKTTMSSLVDVYRPDKKISVLLVTLTQAAPRANVAVIDAQGADMRVLEGTDLNRLDMVIVENHLTKNVHTVLASTLETWMRERGWKPVEAWEHMSKDLYDTVFVRKERTCAS